MDGGIQHITNKVKKRLIYHMWVPSSSEWKRYEPMVRLHMECLRRFAHVFDEALFVISMNDINDKDLLKWYEEEILMMGFRDVTIRPEENTIYCESKAFYYDMASKLKELDGLTFFAHSKGLSNFAGNEVNTIYWVTAMYYYCLHFIDDMERFLISYPYFFYGTLLSKIDGLPNLHKWIYAGTFMWINAIKVHEYGVKAYDFSVPRLTDRSYSELFPGNIASMDGYAGSHEFRYFTYGEDYAIAKNKVSSMHINEQERDDYEDFVRDITDISFGKDFKLD